LFDQSNPSDANMFIYDMNDVTMNISHEQLHKILTLYRLRTLSMALASTFYKNKITAEQQFM